MTEYYVDEQVTLWLGDTLDVLRGMPDESVNCIVTSPPYYGLRDYGIDGQYGLESSPTEYVATMRAVFAEARRVLAKDGTCWINLGDSYATTPPGGRGANSVLHAKAQDSQSAIKCVDVPQKNLLGMPWRVAFTLQGDGWILRNAIVWEKPNAMPESVTDRLSTRYEHVFLLSRSERYWFDLDAIRVPHAASTIAASHRARRPYTAPGQKPNTKSRPTGEMGANPGDVWSISTRPYPEAHFATMPIELPIRCIKAGCKPGGTVLDPFSGSGTTGEASRRLGRRYVGIDLNPAYHDLAVKRFAQGVLDFEAA